MDIRKIIILGIICLVSLPVQAEQFKIWQGAIINKQAITHISPYEYKNNFGIRVFYMSGNSLGYGMEQRQATYTDLKYSSKEERNQKITEMYKWLNQKD